MLTKNIWSQIGINPANTLLPPVHNVGMIILREELTDAENDLHAARVALKTLEEAGASGDTSDLYTAMWKLQKKEQAYFARRYLQTNKAVLRGWHNQVSKYKFRKEASVGHGVQGIVYHVINHPDKVVKRYSVRRPGTLAFLTTKQFVYDRIACEQGFGPQIYEISSDGRVIDLSDKSTIPKFEKGLIISVVMEKIEKMTDQEELLKNSGGIVGVWKKMRQGGLLNVDGFYAHSLKQKAIVAGDFGVVEEATNDQMFIDKMYEFFDSCLSIGANDPGIALKYEKEHPEDSFTKLILKPALDKTYRR
ncbi:unnamed protein product [Ectocarpus sp. 4 AP-2014]|uniref:EsV-1-5 n=1 Tax=Ectocarpus siliculosus virus 1 (isolate New Zealand/Kaikoura/1988) TaxID=654926 RepID=Q8QNQ4_ESV1K|nr:EsV-1-5 [Ectocarpus siliculosus virus 1]AAK14431.1 EsV-1-5 [Ectocarpus siliculosus virus 1]